MITFKSGFKPEEFADAQAFIFTHTHPDHLDPENVKAVVKDKPVFGNSDVALTLSSLFLLSPTMFYQSRYSWNANPIPFFIIFFFLLLNKTLEKTTTSNLLFLGLLVGISFQIDAALTVVFFPFALLWLLLTKFGETKFNLKFLKKVFSYFLVFGLTLLPQLFFELRHQFLNTQAFLAEISGKTNILGEKLSFAQRFWSHLESFKNVNNGALELPLNISLFLLLLATGYMCF